MIKLTVPPGNSQENDVFVQQLYKLLKLTNSLKHNQ